MSSNSDRFLIQQIRQGDQRAWQTLITRYEGRLLAFVDRRLHDRSASEDIVQETFIGFINSLPNFDEHRELQTYLFTIASHKLTDHLRRIGQHPLRPMSESAAIVRCLGQMIRHWQERGELIRVKVLELLWVKGWANRDVAAHLKISE